MAFYWSVGTLAVVNAYSAYEGADAANESAKAAGANAKRRYEFQQGIAVNQMEEQNQAALEKMTEVSRAFLKARGSLTVANESKGISGNSVKRNNAVNRSAFSESKSKIAKETNDNVINIANDMIVKTIDTNATISEAASKMKNVYTSTATGAISGGVQGFQLGSAIKNA